MRWSEGRIRAVAGQAAEQMHTRGAVKAKAGKGDLAAFIREVMMKDREQEEAIEEEARKFLTTIKSLPPPGTGEYQAAFQKAKEMIARRRGFVL